MQTVTSPRSTHPSNFEGVITFGRLTLMEAKAGRTSDNHIVGLWRCECGTEKLIANSRVRSGQTQSCGCLTHTKKHHKHGLRNSAAYSSWRAMKGRCLNPKDKDYPRWGGAGIAIFSEWIASFEAFYGHIGPRPPGTTLDRIDGGKGYVPGNVRWATPKTQASNRSSTWLVEINGVVFPSIDEAARSHGVSDMTIRRWCDGFVDNRRGGKRMPGKPNCRRWRENGSRTA